MKHKYDPFRKIRIIEFIRKFGEDNHRSPTYREIMRGVGLKSTSSVWHHLVDLGFTGYKEPANAKDNTWRKNKEEYMSQWRCPLCKRDLYQDKRE